MLAIEDFPDQPGGLAAHILHIWAVRGQPAGGGKETSFEMDAQRGALCTLHDDRLAEEGAG